MTTKNYIHRNISTLKMYFFFLKSPKKIQQFSQITPSQNSFLRKYCFDINMAILYDEPAKLYGAFYGKVPDRKWFV